VFLLLWLALGALQSAVIATALADLAVQVVRHVLLRRSGIAVTRGHPAGVSAPIAVTVATVVAVAFGSTPT
jgi:hypothetical protein